MPSTTIFRGLTEPTVAGDTGVWGGELNNSIGALDTILGQSVVLQSSTFGTAATLTSSQAQSARVFINNTGAAPFQLNLNSSNFAFGNFCVTNNSSQGQSCTVTAGSSGTGGTSVILPANSQHMVFADGTNITFSDSPFPQQTAIEFGLDGGGAPPSSGRKPGIVLPFTFQALSWELVAWTNGAATLTVTIEVNFASSGFATISMTGSSDPQTGNFAPTATWSSGTLIDVNVTAASSDTKYTVAILGNRLT